MNKRVNKVVTLVCERMDVLARSSEGGVGADVKVAWGGFRSWRGWREVVGVNARGELHVVGVYGGRDGVGVGGGDTVGGAVFLG